MSEFGRSVWRRERVQRLHLLGKSRWTSSGLLPKFAGVVESFLRG